VDEFHNLSRRKNVHDQEMAFYRLLTTQHVFEDSLHVGYSTSLWVETRVEISDERAQSMKQDEEEDADTTAALFWTNCLLRWSFQALQMVITDYRDEDFRPWRNDTERELSV
jgi:hypothetical protein